MSETSAAPCSAAIASLRQIAGIRSSPSGISGDAARFSCRTSRISAAMPAAKSAPASGRAARLTYLNCSSATNVATTKTVKRMRPPGSARHSCGSVRRAAGMRKVSAKATSPIGMLTRKIERQPKCSVRKPPATGPKPLAVTATAAM